MEKKYAIQGIIGCILFGIGDWLLGFVDPKAVEGDVFYFISVGHGLGYADWKIVVTMICAVVGILFFWHGCVHIADLMKDEKDRAGAVRVFTFLSFAWLIIHFIVTVDVFVYSIACRKIGLDQAALLSENMDKVLSPCLYIVYVVASIALIDLVLVVARGRTKLKRVEAFITPLTWIFLIGIISMVLPESAFAKGLYTFCMNGGMMVWFFRILFGGKKQWDYSEYL